MLFIVYAVFHDAGTSLYKTKGNGGHAIGVCRLKAHPYTRDWAFKSEVILSDYAMYMRLIKANARNSKMIHWNSLTGETPRTPSVEINTVLLCYDERSNVPRRNSYGVTPDLPSLSKRA